MRPDRTKVRLIITRHGASEILLSTQLSTWSLPRLEVPTDVRFAEQLVAGTKEHYQLETYCLSINSCPAAPDGSSSDRYAVLEALRQDHEVSQAGTWISSAAAVSEAILSPEERAAVRSALEDLRQNVVEPDKAPFARPGWIEELFGWVQSQIEPLGLRLTGGFRQLNASPTFSLLRIETTGAAVWFKATGEPNAHELPISVALHRAFANYVPQILGVHPTWNAWLSEDVPGSTLDGLADISTWVKAAKALSELQIASVTRTNRLLESGCRDLRLPQLVQQIDPFLVRMSELMAMQTKEPPRKLTDSEIAFLGDRLKAACSELEQFRLPTTLGHLDLNPGNILVSPSRCCFLDWAEASISHPFVTFEYLREQARRCSPQSDALEETVVTAYLQPWNSFFSRETLEHAMAYSPLLAVFAYAVAGKKWRSTEAPQNPLLTGYLRSLVRRAYREAEQLSVRRERCLS
ncbi:MAG TPA: phosphotransferase [Candidatus Acidoferrales bacterium]|nr:phosphotransferase [Candidatus Acidoferrales bacterium]